MKSEWDRIVASFAQDPAVTCPAGKGFGSNALKFGGKIFAMISSRGKFVAKLPRERVEELIHRGQGKRFEPRPGKKMKEWIEAIDDPRLWHALAKEALAAAFSQVPRGKS